MALADIDNNGTLDLYVANFRPDTIRDEPTTKFQGQMVNGRPVITAINGKPSSLPQYTNRFVLTPAGNVLEFGQADVLYRGDGKGHFRSISFTDGSFLDEEGQPLSEPPETGAWRCSSTTSMAMARRIYTFATICSPLTVFG